MSWKLWLKMMMSDWCLASPWVSAPSFGIFLTLMSLRTIHGMTELHLSLSCSLLRLVLGDSLVLLLLLFTVTLKQNIGPTRLPFLKEIDEPAQSSNRSGSHHHQNRIHLFNWVNVFNLLILSSPAAIVGFVLVFMDYWSNHLHFWMHNVKD